MKPSNTTIIEHQPTAPAVEWCLVLEEDRRPDLLVVPMTDGIARVIVDRGALAMATYAAMLAKTPAANAFLWSMDFGSEIEPDPWECHGIECPGPFLRDTGIGLLPGISIENRWVQEVFRRINEHSSGIEFDRIDSKKKLEDYCKQAVRKYAETVFNHAVRRIFVGIVCDGAVVSRRPLEEAARMICAGVPTWPLVIHGAILTVQEMADRCPKLEAVIQKTQYRREDVAEREAGPDSRAAAMRESKRAKLIDRDEWIVGRYARERSKHQAGEYGNVPTMEAVVDEWNRAGSGRRIANVKTVRRILKARGIDPAAPDATP